MGVGSFQRKVGSMAWVGGSWASPMSSARRPVGATRLAAMGRIDSKCSTARRVTMSAAGFGEGPLPRGCGRSEAAVEPNCWARPQNTLTPVKVVARITSRRNVAFL